MGAKSNFMQAARELLGAAPEEEPEKGKRLLREAPPAAQAEKRPGAAPASGAAEKAGGRSEGHGRKTGQQPSGLPDAARMDRSERPAPGEPPALTSIAAEAVLEGTLTARGGIHIYGIVKGDVSSEQDISLCGRLEGDASCRNLSMRGGKMIGSITSAGRVEIDADSVLSGDIKADCLDLNGKVKGNLEIRHTLTLGGCAEVLGDLSADSLSVSEGSVIQGRVQVCPEEKKQSRQSPPSP